MPKTKEQIETIVNERIYLALASPEEQNTQRYRKLQKRVDHEEEYADLCASEIACAVADAWADPDSQVELHQQAANERLVAALDRLEAATRGSALRKVRP